MAFNKAKALKEAEKYTAQNKVSAAIKKYEEILKHDRSDLSLLNTLGDLYVRDKKVPKAFEYFNRLGDAYMKEGFNLKGIAILRKVLKLDPESPSAHAKLAELYTLQGLTSEARPLYLKAANIFLKANKNEQAIDALYRLVNIEPANANYRTRLADILLQLRRTSEAVGLYGELFDTLVTKKDLASAQKAVDKIARAAPKDPRLASMKARLLFERGDQEGAIKALSPDGGIPKDPAAQKMLLEAYVATQNLEGAEKLTMENYRATPSDFAPLQNYCKACVNAGDLSRALSPLKELADDIVKNGQSEALAETLKGILSLNSEHLGSLELIRKVYTDTQKETALPQILESLAHEYVKFDRKQEARGVYEQLLTIEPHNEDAKNYLNSTGGGAPAAPPSASPAMETAMGSAIEPAPEKTFGLESTPAAATPPAKEEALDAFTKEAFQNADLYAGYLKVDKAVEELEKVLARHPGHILANEKLVEVCYPSHLDRAGQAAQALQELYKQQGDAANSAKYGELAQKCSQEASSPPPAAGSEKGFEISGPGAVPGVPEPAAAAAPPAGDAAPGFEISGPSAIPGMPEPTAAPPAGDEADLSADMGEMFGDAPGAAPAAPAAPPFNAQQAQEEVQFFLSQKLFADVQQALEGYEKKYPGNPELGKLRQRTERFIAKHGKEAPAPGPAIKEMPPPSAGPQIVEQPIIQQADPIPPAIMEAPPIMEASPIEEVPPTTPNPLPPPVAAASVPSVGLGDAGSGLDFLAELADEVNAGLQGVEQAPRGKKASGVAVAEEVKAAPKAPQGPLSDLLEELEEHQEEAVNPADSETHFNLGIAFREMGLLDEAISEFQKVVISAKTNMTENHGNLLNSCHMLALCFMEKGMASVAVKWYKRALKIPQLDSETIVALQYDLGNAYEYASDFPAALENFTEVYSQNIDYRDVSERIQSLQSKKGL